MTHLFKLVPAILLSLEEYWWEGLAALCCEWWGGCHFLPDLWLQLEPSVPDGLQLVDVIDLFLAYIKCQKCPFLTRDPEG